MLFALIPAYLFRDTLDQMARDTVIGEEMNGALALPGIPDGGIGRLEGNCRDVGRHRGTRVRRKTHLGTTLMTEATEAILCSDAYNGIKSSLRVLRATIADEHRSGK